MEWVDMVLWVKKEVLEKCPIDFSSTPDQQIGVTDQY